MGGVDECQWHNPCDVDDADADADNDDDDDLRAEVLHIEYREISGRDTAGSESVRLLLPVRISAAQAQA